MLLPSLTQSVTLFCFVLMSAWAPAQALKLTPVQQLTQRVDLASEVRSTTTTLSVALLKFQQGEIPLHDSKQLMESHDMQKLQAVVRRWNNIADRVRMAIAPSSPSQVSVYFLQLY